MNWILNAEGEARRHRANIACWRNSSSLLWEMVTKHSSVTMQTGNRLAGKPMRILGSTRLLVTCIIALKSRVFAWCAWLHAQSLNSSALDDVMEKHVATLERLDDWDVGSLFSGITQEPEALVATYRLLETLTFGDVQSAANALYEVGHAAEQVAWTAAG